MRSRRRIALSQAERIERDRRLAEKREDDHRAYRKAFYALGAASADRDVMLVLAQRALVTATDGDSIARWKKWVSVLKSGRRVKVSSHPLEVFAGEALDRLEAGRAFFHGTEFEEARRQLT